MPVTLLQGENLRCHGQFRIEPHPSLNLILGPNASGKTSLLEALFVTVRGRSFRAQNLSELCGRKGGAWHVFMTVAEGIDLHRIGLGWTRQGTELRFDEDRQARMVDVVRCVPMQIIDPGAHRLLEEGPAYRRSFVDWGVFHVEHRFLETWRRYQRALRQRNRALREQLGVRSVKAWDEELADSGEVLNQQRERHVQALTDGFSSWTRRLLDIDDVRCDWSPGWNAEESFRASLDRTFEQHVRQGTTIQGPHRAELRISVEDTRVRGRISRGQQKMLIAAMVLAQAELLAASGCRLPILLLDDFASELAPDFQAKLAEGLRTYAGQKFITAFERPIGFQASDLPMAMFHVEHGQTQAGHRHH